MAAFTSAFGLLFLAVQTQFQTKLAKAQFVNELSEDVDRNIDLEVQLEQGGRLYDLLEEIPEADHQSIVKFLTFFDRLYHLLRLGVIPLNIIDNMFAYRFFILVHNPNVQKFELLGEQTRHYWLSVFSLHKMWYAYRIRKRLPILRPDGAKDSGMTVFTREAVHSDIQRIVDLDAAIYGVHGYGHFIVRQLMDLFSGSFFVSEEQNVVNGYAIVGVEGVSNRAWLLSSASKQSRKAKASAAL